MTTLVLEAIATWAGLCVCAAMLWHLFVDHNKRRPPVAMSRLCALCQRRHVAAGEYICGRCCAHLLEGPGPNVNRHAWQRKL